jgi:hypothetical protein
MYAPYLAAYVSVCQESAAKKFQSIMMLTTQRLVDELPLNRSSLRLQHPRMLRWPLRCVLSPLRTPAGVPRGPVFRSVPYPRTLRPLLGAGLACAALQPYPGPV